MVRKGKSGSDNKMQKHLKYVNTGHNQLMKR